MRLTLFFPLILLLLSCRGPEVLNGVWKPGEADVTVLKDHPLALVSLDGPWKYALKRFLSGEEMPWSDLPDTRRLNGGWRLFLPDGPHYGGVTIRLQIRLPEENRTWGLILPDSYTAYTLYAGGVQALKVGNSSLNSGFHRPVVRPASVLLPVEGKNLELIIHISNQEMHTGGFQGDVLFGSAEAVIRENSRRTAVSLFLIGIIASVGLLYLLIYSLNPLVRYNLFFGLLCLIIAVRMGLMDQRILVLLADLNFPLESDLEYGTVLFVVVILGAFIRNMFSQALGTWPLYVVYAGHLFFLLALILLPVYEFSQIFISYYPLLVGTLGLYLYALVKAWHLALPGSRFFLLQIFVLSLTGMWDYTYSLGVHTGGFHLSEVFLVAVIFQALWMSMRRSRMLEETKQNSGHLQELETRRMEVMDSVARELPARIEDVSAALARCMAHRQSLSLPQQRLLGGMYDSHLRLESLVADLKSYLDSRRSSETFQIISMDLGEALREIASALPETALRQRLSIQIRSPSPAVKADPSRLRIALKILMTHLLRLKPGNLVVAESGSLGTREVWLTLTLMNHWWKSGQISGLFSPFSGESEATQAEKGAVLDLPLAKEFIFKMGGRLEAVNQGPGARFSLVLPSGDISEISHPGQHREVRPDLPEAAPVPGLTVQDAGSGKQAFLLPGGRHILAVDDEPVNLRLLAHQLARTGWKYTMAEGGQEALEKTAREPVGLILLDVMMPKVDGFQVLESLRKTRTMEELPVVLVTAKSLPEDLKAGLNAGANAYVTKPFSQDRISALLARLIRRQVWMDSPPGGGKDSARDLQVSVVLMLPADHCDMVLPLGKMEKIPFPISNRDREFFLIRSGTGLPVTLIRILETRDMLRSLADYGFLSRWGVGISYRRGFSGIIQGLKMAGISWQKAGDLIMDGGLPEGFTNFPGLKSGPVEGLPEVFNLEEV